MPEGVVRDMLKGATALKAYLKEQNICPSELAKKCQIDKGYLSRLLNGQRSNPGFPLLVRLAAGLGLPAVVVQKLLQTAYDSYVLEDAPEALKERACREKFFHYLTEVLDASDDSETSQVADLTQRIRKAVPDSFPMKTCYLCWYEAYILTLQDKFETSIALFLQALKFFPKYDVEKRFKAKVLLGLGTAYMARGNYPQSIRAFRQSLLLWDEGFQVGRVNMNLGTLYRRLGRYERSNDAYEKAYESGTLVIRLYANAGLIQVALDRKDYDAARKLVVRGYIEAKTTDSQRGKGDLYCNIAEYYLAIGKLRQSEAFFRKAILFADKAGGIRTKHWAEVELAVLFSSKGSVKQFDDVVRKLASELSGEEDVLLIAKHLNAKGRYHLERHEPSIVVHILEKGYALLNSTSAIDSKECCEMLYKAHLALHEPKLATFYLNEMKKCK